MLKYLGAGLIEAIRRDRVVLELRPARCCRVENRLSKDALPLGRRRNDAKSCNASPQSRALPIPEEKCFIRLDRTAERCAIYVAAELGLGAWLSKEISRIESFIPEELKYTAMELICPRLSNDHDGSAVRPPVFGRVCVHVQLELGNPVDDGIVDDLSRFRLQNADAVIHVLVCPRSAAIDSR